MESVTGKTAELVESWISAKKSVAAAEGRLQNALTDLKIARNKLGGWLVPVDYRNDEVFNIWFGSGILQVTAAFTADGREYDVIWRKEPEGKQLLEQGS